MPDSATSSTGEVCSGMSTLHESGHGWDEVMLERGMESAGGQVAGRRQILVDAGIRTFAFCRMSRGEIAAYRRRPGTLPPGWGGIQASTLRYSDEQTIGAVAALVMAVGRLGGSSPATFQRWGVVAASRFLGRSNLLAAMNRFQVEGVWGVSPHLIPHFALHSPAGTLSLVLGIHGPNLGTGGGRFCLTDGVLTALSWLSSGIVPGVWLVATGWSPEMSLEDDAQPREDAHCESLALALVPGGSEGASGFRLRLVASLRATEPSPIDIAELAENLQRQAGDLPRNGANRRRLIAHATHAGSTLPEPHFAPHALSRSRLHKAGTDATGSYHVELAAPELHRINQEA